MERRLSPSTIFNRPLPPLRGSPSPASGGRQVLRIGAPRSRPRSNHLRPCTVVHPFATAWPSSPRESMSLDSQVASLPYESSSFATLKGTQGLATRHLGPDPDPGPDPNPDLRSPIPPPTDSKATLTFYDKPQSHTHRPSAAAPASSPASVP